MDWIYFIRIAVLLLLLAAVGYAFFVEPLLIRLTKRTVHIADLPESLDGVTICHMSDLHIAKWSRLERALRVIVSDLEADICVVTGDILHCLQGLPALRSVFECVDTRYGVFGVLGNGEHCPPMPGAALAEELSKAGIDLMVNRNVSLRIRDATLQIIGVDDPYTGLDDVDQAFADLSPGSPRLLLAHSPDVIRNLGHHHVDLILAGHTHGGQIRLPLMKPLWTHCRYGLRSMASGHFGPEELSKAAGQDLGSVQMYVSRGVSGSGMRARFLCPPEVTLITLSRGEPG